MAHGQLPGAWTISWPAESGSPPLAVTHICISACLQSFQRRSHGANLPNPGLSGAPFHERFHAGDPGDMAGIAKDCSQRQLVSHIRNGIFVGVKPFIRTAVRVRCALSAKPAACAARVTDAPSASRLNAVRYRCQSRYRRIGTPTCSRNKCWSRLSDKCAIRVRSSTDGGGDGVVRRWSRTAPMRSSYSGPRYA